MMIRAAGRPKAIRARSFTVFWSFTVLSCVLSLAAAFAQQSASGQMAAIEEEVKAQQFGEAATKLSDLLGRNPQAGAEAYRLLAFSQYKQQHIEQALEACMRGLTLYPDSLPLAGLYVSILRERAPEEERLTLLTRAAEKLPRSAAVLKPLGEELLNKDPQNPQAMVALASAAKLAPQDPEAHFFYGEAACFNNQDDLCIRELTRAHELSPDNKYANMQLYTMIAVAEDRQNNRVLAGQAFQRSLAANRQLPKPSPYAAVKYVTFLSAQDKQKEAMAVIDEILKWDSAYGPAHFERAKLLAQQEHPEEAAQEAELALHDARVSPAELRTYHAFLAKTYFALGREHDARVHQDWIESQHLGNAVQ